MNTEKAARRISQLILKMQDRFAGYMNKKTATCSAAKLKMCFLSGCSVFIALSTWVIVDAFITRGSVAVIKVSHVRIVKPVDDHGKYSIIISRAEYDKLKIFRRYMDSLLRSTTGKHIYDSILFHRPGLMDSVQLLEKLYTGQPH